MRNNPPFANTLCRLHCYIKQELGSLLARVFQGPDEMRMTASDMAAGLALVRAVQKQKEDQKVQSRVRLHLEREGAVAGYGDMCHTF